MHEYVAHSMLPGGDYIFDFGDVFEGPLTRAHKGDEYPRTHPQGHFNTNYNLLYRMAQRFQSGEAQGVAEWLKGFGHVNAEDFWSLVWYDAKLKPVPIEKQQAWHYFPDHEVFYWRSNWSKDATAFAFKCWPARRSSHGTAAQTISRLAFVFRSCASGCEQLHHFRARPVPDRRQWLCGVR
jgi:hypothetical protein